MQSVCVCVCAYCVWLWLFYSILYTLSQSASLHILLCCLLMNRVSPQSPTCRRFGSSWRRGGRRLRRTNTRGRPGVSLTTQVCLYQCLQPKCSFYAWDVDTFRNIHTRKGTWLSFLHDSPYPDSSWWGLDLNLSYAMGVMLRSAFFSYVFHTYSFVTALLGMKRAVVHEWHAPLPSRQLHNIHEQSCKTWKYCSLSAVCHLLARLLNHHH